LWGAAGNDEMFGDLKAGTEEEGGND